MASGVEREQQAGEVQVRKSSLIFQGRPGFCLECSTKGTPFLAAVCPREKVGRIESYPQEVSCRRLGEMVPKDVSMTGAWLSPNITIYQILKAVPLEVILNGVTAATEWSSGLSRLYLKILMRGKYLFF